MFMAYQPHIYERDQRARRQQGRPGANGSSSQLSSTQSTSYLESTPSSDGRPSEDGSRRESDQMRRIPSSNSAQSHLSSSSMLSKMPWRRKTSVKHPDSERPRLPSLVKTDTHSSSSQPSSSSTSEHTEPLVAPYAVGLYFPTPSSSIQRAQEMHKSRSVSGDAAAAGGAPAMNGGTPLKKKTGILRGKSKRPSTAGGKMQTFMESTETKSSLARLAASRSEQDLLNPSGDGDVQEVLLGAEDGQALSVVQRRSRTIEGLQIAATTFDNVGGDVDLSGYPLPVRLGLALPESFATANTTPSTAASSTVSLPPASPEHTRRTRKVKAQYVDGYYLCTPPPRVHRNQGLPLTPLMSPSPQASPSSARSPQSDRLRPPALSNASVTSSRPHSPAAGAWKTHEYFDIQTYKNSCRFGSKERKVHAYPIEEAPYPWGYGNDSLMADVLIHTAFARSVGASIMKWKDGPPKRVLDIGCGVGHWVTDMALQWPDTEFVGLDLVPIQKSLPVFDRATSNVDGDDAVVGSAVDLQKRITWVVANALEGLPFPSKSFDFVHIRFLNDGVPERKWPKLLTEVTRVLAPQGQLELIELDFSFFGSPMRMRTTDLMDLILGRLNGDMSEGLSCWPVKPKNREDLEASKRNAGLHAILRQTLNRRGINLNPTSILPFYINALDGVQSTSHTDLRQIPILARSHRRTFGQIRPSSAGGRGASSSSSTSFGSLDTMTRKDEQLESSIDALLGLNFVEGAHAFSSHPHMKNNVPDVHIRVQDLDALRMAIMQADTLRITDNKHVFWQEVESLRKQLAHEAVKASGLPTSDSGSSLGPRASTSGSSLRVTSHEANVAACVKRWPDSATFERDLDFWQADMQDRTDVDSLLRHKMRGGDAANRMDGWQQLESMRKKAQRGRRMTFDDEDQGRSHDSPVDLMHTTASSSDSADSSSPVKKEQQQLLGAVSSASSSVKAALSETTEILGFRTASFYVVQRNDDKSPHGSPTKRLSQISAASITPSGSGLIG